MAAGADDGAVHLWSLSRLIHEDKLRNAAAAVASAAAAENDGGGSDACPVIDIDAPVYMHQGAVNSVCFGLQGDVVASCSDDSSVKVFSLTGKAVRYTLGGAIGGGGHSEGVGVGGSGGGDSMGCFSQDVVNEICFGGAGGGALFTASADKTLRVFNARNSDLVCSMGGHEDELLCVAVAPEGGPQIVTGSADGSLRFWSEDVDALM